MAESQSKKRDSDQIRGDSSSQRFYKRRRGHWGHSRGSINAALAIAPTTAAPPASNGGGTMAAPAPATINSNSNQSIIGQAPKQQRHGRKRRRHRHSSFSGGNNEKATSSSYSLPPAVAAALAIPPKTPEVHDPIGSNSGDGVGDLKMEISSLINAPHANGGGVQQAATSAQPSTSGTSTAPNGSSSTAMTAGGGGGGKKKKRRTRRRQRRNWKPYYKLTADERRELEEREEKRAERVRAKRFAHGQPVAPYNTTQFLLRDRELRNGGEPDCGDLDEIVRNIRHHTRSGSYESPGALGASDSDGGDLSSDNSDYSYLEREFDNDWLDEQRGRLETMTKDDLVKEFMDLQKQYESAQRDMRSKRLSYEEQISNLQRENDELRSSRIIPQEITQKLAVRDSATAAAESASDSVDDFNYSSSSSASASTNEAVVTVSVK